MKQLLLVALMASAATLRYGYTAAHGQTAVNDYCADGELADTDVDIAPTDAQERHTSTGCAVRSARISFAPSGVTGPAGNRIVFECSNGDFSEGSALIVRGGDDESELPMQILVKGNTFSGNSYLEVASNVILPQNSTVTLTGNTFTNPTHVDDHFAITVRDVILNTGSVITVEANEVTWGDLENEGDIASGILATELIIGTRAQLIVRGNEIQSNGAENVGESRGIKVFAWMRDGRVVVDGNSVTVAGDAIEGGVEVELEFEGREAEHGLGADVSVANNQFAGKFREPFLEVSTQGGDPRVVVSRNAASIASNPATLRAKVENPTDDAPITLDVLDNNIVGTNSRAAIELQTPALPADSSVRVAGNTMRAGGSQAHPENEFLSSFISFTSPFSAANGSVIAITSNTVSESSRNDDIALLGWEDADSDGEATIYFCSNVRQGAPLNTEALADANIFQLPRGGRMPLTSCSDIATTPATTQPAVTSATSTLPTGGVPPTSAQTQPTTAAPITTSATGTGADTPTPTEPSATDAPTTTTAAAATTTLPPASGALAHATRAAMAVVAAMGIVGLLF